MRLSALDRAWQPARGAGLCPAGAEASSVRREACVRSFARHVDVRSELEEAAAFRLDDPNVSERERAAVRRLLASQYD
jgi:hypothetical protein